MESSLSGLRVLLVEDEPLLAWELELALAAAGAVVVGPGSTLKMSFALARDNAIAAAVIDFRLGQEEVGPLAAYLYEHRIPFIIHTGHRTTDHTAWGSPPVVRKPADPDRVIEALASLMRQGRTQRAATVSAGQSG